MVSRFVLWIQKPSASGGLERPRALFSSAPLEHCHKWRGANRWADGIPLVHWNDSVGIQYLAGGAPLSVPGRVENAPAAWGEVRRPAALGTFPAALDAMILSATEIAHHIGAPCWQIGAECDDGALAIGIAAAHGRAVALSPSMPGQLFLAMSSQRGISLSQRTVSDAADPLNRVFRPGEVSDEIGAEDGPDGVLQKRVH